MSRAQPHQVPAQLFAGATGWLRQDSDKKFLAELAPGMDGLLVTANMVEKSPESLAGFLRQFRRPFLVHPQLHRFQFPGHFTAESGKARENMSRLGATYGQGTGLALAVEPLRGNTISDAVARVLAANVLRHETLRLTQADAPLYLESLDLTGLGTAAPMAGIAPTLSYGHLDENFRASVRLARASAELTGGQAFLEVCVDVNLLRRVAAIEEIANEFGPIPTPGYLLQLIGLDDVAFACDSRLQRRVIQLVSRLAANAPAVHLLGGGFAARLLRYAGVTGYALALNPTNVHGRVAPIEGRPRKALRHYLAGAFRAYDYDSIARAAGRLTPDAFHGPSGACSACDAVGITDVQALIDTYTQTERKEGQKRRDPTSAAYNLNVFHYGFEARQEWDLAGRLGARDVGELMLEQGNRLDKLVNIDHLIGLSDLATTLSRGIQLNIAIGMPRRRPRTGSEPRTN